jgi:hypothetical protein
MMSTGGSPARQDAGSPSTGSAPATVPDAGDASTAADTGPTDPCANPSADADSDGTRDCDDGCPQDPDKTAAGTCGCGVAEDDSDGDATPDCMDGCPFDPATATAGSCAFPFTPSNFDPTGLDPSVAGATTIIGCSAVLDTSGTPSFTTWCSGPQPQITVVTQTDAPELVVVAMQSLVVTGTLRVTGPRPAVFAVWGDATIQGSGTINASASGSTPGGGGNQLCDMNRGEGGDSASTAGDTGGGGGGGFGTAGGRGGTGDSGGEPAGAGGVVRGTAELSPLLGGCPGGGTNQCNNGAGAGGGAVQISAGAALRVMGDITANGGNGTNSSCGAGGGSGGGILLEGSNVDLTGSTLSASGGDGSDASAGGPNGAQGSTSPSAAGGNGSNGNGADGGSGGGGGYGRIRATANGGTCTGCP